MEIVGPNLQALYTNFSNLFQQGLLMVKPRYKDVAQVLPSDTEQETYAWQDYVPQLRQWIGPRYVQAVVGRSYTLPNQPYELTMELDRFKIQDNKINQFGNTVKMMGREASLWPDRLLFGTSTLTGGLGVLYNGENVLTYDGQNFFSAAHPIDPENPGTGSQSNYYAAGYGLTGANGLQNFATVYQNMTSILGKDGNPIGVSPTKLIHAPQLRSAVRQILKADIIATSVGINAAQAQSNIWKDTVEPIELPYLASDPTTWYLVDDSAPIKPFIFQQREAPQFIMRTRPEDEANWSRHKFQYGIEARGAAGYGLWFFAAKARA